jgi:hypothetical protein
LKDRGDTGADWETSVNFLRFCIHESSFPENA